MTGSIDRFAVILCAIVIPQIAVCCDDLVVSHAWIREPPPVANVAAGYFVIDNVGNESTTIERVESACCESVQMHKTTFNGEQARMVSLHKLVVAAGERASFKRGGKHLMLHAPTMPLRQGAFVELEFFCAEGGSFHAEFEVKTTR